MASDGAELMDIDKLNLGYLGERILMLVDDLTAGDPGYASTLRGGLEAPGPGLAQFLGKCKISSLGFGINNNASRRYWKSLD